MELACYAVDIPTKDDTYVMSHGRVLHSFPTTIVRVTAEDGTTGFGEACTLGSNYLDGFAESVRATIRELAPWALACDPFESDVLVDGMDARLIGHLPGKAAIDNAMWDLRGKLLGLPAARLLGGVKQESFGAFQAISLAAPEAMADEVRRMADVGFRQWQLKLGDNPIDDAARLHAVVNALPTDSTFLTSDANAGWTVAETLRFLQATHGVDTYLEQPCASLGELARIKPHSQLPVMVDESAKTSGDILTALSLGCIDAINLKPVRVGGLTKAARIRDLCQAAGVSVMVDEPQGADLATAGMVQLAATIEPRHFLACSYFKGSHMPISYQTSSRQDGQPQLQDGEIRWGDAPGLGVDIDMDVLGEPLFRVTS